MLNRGCPGALFALKTALQKRKEHPTNFWVLFVDLVKAFDTVNCDALITILKKLSVRSPRLPDQAAPYKCPSET